MMSSITGTIRSEDKGWGGTSVYGARPESRVWESVVRLHDGLLFCSENIHAGFLRNIAQLKRMYFSLLNYQWSVFNSV
jgi:hypothetical protein